METPTHDPRLPRPPRRSTPHDRAGRYTSDVSLPGQLHAAFLRADRAHADIIAIDIGAAKAAPGVHLVLLGAETEAAGWHRTQALLPFKGVGGHPLLTPPRPALATDRVRFVGEPVALVVADTPDAAQDALELIVVEYADRPALPTAAAALAPRRRTDPSECPGQPLLRIRVWRPCRDRRCFRRGRPCGADRADQ